MTLFDQDGAGLDAIYLRLRATDDAGDAEQRAYLDSLWTRARPHLDGNFKSAFARNTAQRFWELRLTVAFLDLGYTLDASSEGRPDLATRLSTGERLWIEAVAPTLGALNNPDRPAGLIVMLVAGDLVRGGCVLERVTDRPALYVGGNHEALGANIDIAVEKAREAAVGTNVRVMQNNI